MRLPLSDAAEQFLCPPHSWRVELRSPHSPTDCADVLLRRRANLLDDVRHRAGGDMSDFRWTGSMSPDWFDIVEAGLDGHVRALGTVRPATAGSTIDLRFRLERRQFIWDLFFVAVSVYLLFAIPYPIYVAAGALVMLALYHASWPRKTCIEANRLTAFVSEATGAEITKTEGGVSRNPRNTQGNRASDWIGRLPRAQIRLDSSKGNPESRPTVR